LGSKLKIFFVESDVSRLNFTLQIVVLLEQRL
jgi:hypothetical protein